MSCDHPEMPVLVDGSMRLVDLLKVARIYDSDADPRETVSAVDFIDYLALLLNPGRQVDHRRREYHREQREPAGRPGRSPERALAVAG